MAKFKVSDAQYALLAGIYSRLGTFGNNYDAALYYIALEERLAAAEKCRRMLENLLARIHRDGGHYTAQHGMEKSFEDAEHVWASLIQRAEEAEKERDATKAEFDLYSSPLEEHLAAAEKRNTAAILRKENTDE